MVLLRWLVVALVLSLPAWEGDSTPVWASSLTLVWEAPALPPWPDAGFRIQTCQTMSTTGCVMKNLSSLLGTTLRQYPVTLPKASSPGALQCYTVVTVIKSDSAGSSYWVCVPLSS